jgi:two-component system, chemotaxis family, CheB/CheR fusion protein
VTGEFFIVGIGASAGGESPLYDFFENLPSETHAAYVVVRHLKRDFQSQMKFLLSRHTKLPVFTIRDGEIIKPDAIYLMPENKTVTIKHSQFVLSNRKPDEIGNFAIDSFFTSLAHERRDKAVGIILSGGGTDGTKGSQAIEECGGMVMVQDPEAAKFDSMPSNAIQFDHPDYVLPAREMAKELVTYFKSKMETWT